MLYLMYTKKPPSKMQKKRRGGAEFGDEFRNIQSEHKVQQWRKFLLNPKNKKAFTDLW